MTLTFDLDPLLVVRIAAMVFAVLTLGAVLDLTLGTRLRNRAHRRRHAGVRQAFDAVVSLTDPATDPAQVAQQLRELPDRVVEEALTVTARSLAGRDRDRFREVADHVGVHDRARAQLRSRRWWRRLRAVRVLRMTSAQAPVLELFDDEEPEIRAAAALWVGSLLESGEALPAAGGRWAATSSPATEAADRLADGLLDPAALVRLATKHAVGRGGAVPVDAVERALTRCLADPDRPSLLPVAPLAAAAALGTAVDPQLVTPFLDDHDARVRAAAVRADAAVQPERVAELCDRFVVDDQVVREAVAAVAGRDLASAHHLVGLSADDAWQVRQIARRSLGRLGPVGRALLRRVQREAAA
ncbi:hypothetical protein FTX61_16605 [Nitriliruptoraceae bacterium ZYF776]|nr:hypothetical protein [Profundirhabdus halotolerans]